MNRNCLKRTAISLIPYIALVIATLFEFRGFFSQGSIMIGDFVPSSPWVVRTGEPNTLNPTYYGGGFNLNLAQFPIDFVVSLLSSLVGSETAYRVFFILIPITGGIAIITFLKKIFSASRFGPLEYTISALLYSNNPWVISEGILPGHTNSLLLAYAITPFLFLFAIRYVQSRRLRDALFASIVFALIGSIFYYWIFFILPAFFIFPLVHAYVQRDRNGFRRYLDSLTRAMFIYVVGLLMSLYWLLPYAAVALHYAAVAASGSTTIALGPQDIKRLSRFATPTNTVRLLGYWFPKFTFGIFQTSNPILNYAYYGFSFTYFALFVPHLLFRRRFRWPNDSLWVFAIILVPVYVILAGGTQILGGIYSSLVWKLPLLDDPILFVGMLAFVYAIVIPLTLNRLIEISFNARLKRKFTALLVVILILAGMMISVWPSLTGTFNGSYSPVPEPPEYAQAYAWLAEHSSGFRTLWLPSDAYVNLSWYGRSGVSDPVRWKTQSPVLNPPGGSILSPGTTIFMLQIQRLLFDDLTRNIGRILSVASVKFLVVRTDVVPTSYSQRILNSAFQQNDLKLVWHRGYIYIFENQEPTEYLQLARQKLVVFGGFNSLIQLPSFGFNLTETAVLFPEQTPQRDLLTFLNDSSTRIFLPARYSLDLIASLVPQRFWVDLAPYASETWHYDQYAGIPSGDLLYGGFALSTTTSSTLAVPFNSNSAGNITILIRLLGDEMHYRVTVDGHNVSKVMALTPPTGFRWVEYSIQSSPGSHVLEISTPGSGYYAVNSICIIPNQYWRATMQLVRKIALKPKILTIVSASDLYPLSGASWVNLFDMDFLSPLPLALNFSSNGQPYAGSGGLYIAYNTNYTMGALAYLNEGRTMGKVVLMIFSKKNNTWISFPISINQSQLSWSIMTFQVPQGSFEFQYYAANVTLSSFFMAPSTWSYSPLSMVSERTEYNINYFKTGPSSFKGSVRAPNGSYILMLSYSYNPLWKASVDNSPARTILVNSFGIGVVVDEKNGSNTSFTFSFEPQQYEEVGLLATLCVLSTVLMLIAIETCRSTKLPGGKGSTMGSPRREQN